MSPFLTLCAPSSGLTIVAATGDGAAAVSILTAKLAVSDAAAT